jgi:hypothetical protein
MNRSLAWCFVTLTASPAFAGRQTQFQMPESVSSLPVFGLIVLGILVAAIAVRMVRHSHQ